MEQLGYENQYGGGWQSDYNKASAIFYKRDKFQVLETFRFEYSQLYCIFALKEKENFRFIFGETNFGSENGKTLAESLQ